MKLHWDSWKQEPIMDYLLKKRQFYHTMKKDTSFVGNKLYKNRWENNKLDNSSSPAKDFVEYQKPLSSVSKLCFDLDVDLCGRF